MLVPHHLGFLYLGTVPNHWCQVSELTSRTNWTKEEIKNISIPFEDGKYDTCLMYDLNYSQLAENYEFPEDLRSDIKQQEVRTRTCNAWDYDTSTYQSTIATQVRLQRLEIISYQTNKCFLSAFQYDLVCDDLHYVAFIQVSSV